MAASVRPPGDVTTHVEYGNRRYRYNGGFNNPGDERMTPYGGWTDNQQLVKKTYRPTWTKGAVVTLPGGLTFRKGTNYLHEMFELVFSGAGLYEFSGWTRKDGLIYSWGRAQDEGREIGQIIQNPPLIFSSVSQDATNEAVTKALNKIADQKINLGENLATFGQTLSLFTSKSALLLDALQYAKKVKSWQKLLNKSARDLSRAGPLNVAAQEYLAYVYGLKPLCEDVYTASKLLKDSGAKTLLFKGVGRATRMKGPKPRGLGPFSYSRMTVLSGNGTQRVKATIWGQLDPNASALRSLNQLGLLNPFGLAWDLVPYSFVVDWFLPVGPVLYAMTAPVGLTFVDGSLSARTSEVTQIEYATENGGLTYSDSLKDPKFEKKFIFDLNSERFSRSVMTNWPTPGLWFDLDPFRADRPLKALALGILALSGSRPPIR